MIFLELPFRSVLKERNSVAGKKTSWLYWLLGGAFFIFFIGVKPSWAFEIIICGILFFLGLRWYRVRSAGKLLAEQKKRESAAPAVFWGVVIDELVAVPATVDAHPATLVDVELPAQPTQPQTQSTPGKRSDFAYTIPTAPKNFSGDGRWISGTESIKVNGFVIAQGMVYVGATLPDAAGAPDPALIDPRKPISQKGDFTERQMGYWPSYSDISPSARNAYLRWLADGKCHPEADIGYVFLYFYGLERRVLVDAPKDKAAQAERLQIRGELKRLLAIYGTKSDSFNGYCRRLLDFLELATYSGKLYEKPVPELMPGFELPYYLRLAIGQAVVDGAPVPVHLAVAWIMCDAGITRRTAANRCKAEFLALLQVKYRQVYGEGFKIPVNRTKLKFPYHPASAGLRHDPSLDLLFGDIPDIAALTAPIKKLQSIVDACSEELDAYSRFVGKNPDKRTTLEALLQLPLAIWPPVAREKIALLKADIGNQFIALPLQELANRLGGFSDINGGISGEINSALNKESLRGLVKILAAMNIGIEPDFLNHAKLPKANMSVVLFQTELSPLMSGLTPAYQAALVTLELAAAVAHADGDFSESELMALDQHIASWRHLTPAHRQRLNANARLLQIEPVTLASMKKKIEPLDIVTREAIADFTAVVAYADGNVSHDGIKLLEKIYKLLGVEQEKVYTHLHSMSKFGSGAPAKNAEASAFTLDATRIALLQQDSEKVAALLGNIFTDDAEPEAIMVATPIENEPDTAMPESRLLGLDGAHSAFVRMLLSRPLWSRNELADVAIDSEVMLDGALERINEATLDAWDIVCAEGDDPIEINLEIINKLTL